MKMIEGSFQSLRKEKLNKFKKLLEVNDDNQDGELIVDSDPRMGLIQSLNENMFSRKSMNEIKDKANNDRISKTQPSPTMDSDLNESP